MNMGVSTDGAVTVTATRETVTGKPAISIATVDRSARQGDIPPVAEIQPIAISREQYRDFITEATVREEIAARGASEDFTGTIDALVNDIKGGIPIDRAREIATTRGIRPAIIEELLAKYASDSASALEIDTSWTPTERALREAKRHGVDFGSDFTRDALMKLYEERLTAALPMDPGEHLECTSMVQKEYSNKMYLVKVTPGSFWSKSAKSILEFTFSRSDDACPYKVEVLDASGIGVVPGQTKEILRILNEATSDKRPMPYEMRVEFSKQALLGLEKSKAAATPAKAKPIHRASKPNEPLPELMAQRAALDSIGIKTHLAPKAFINSGLALYEAEFLSCLREAYPDQEFRAKKTTKTDMFTHYHGSSTIERIDAPAGIINQIIGLKNRVPIVQVRFSDVWDAKDGHLMGDVEVCLLDPLSSALENVVKTVTDRVVKASTSTEYPRVDSSIKQVYGGIR